MSICRTTIVECHTEADADAVIADYNANFDSMFPECEMSINSRVNPTTIISNSVYANQEAIEKTGTGARQAFIEKHKYRQKKYVDLCWRCDTFKIKFRADKKKI